MMQSLQQKLHINLKNLPSNSGGSSSYSNKDLSERLQGIMRQRGQGGGGHLTTGVSPTLKPVGGGASSQIASWPNDGLDMDSSNRTERDCGADIPLLLQNGSGKGAGGGATSSLHAAIAGNSNMPPIPANLSQDPYVYLQWRQQKHKSCRSAHPNHQANYLLNQRKAASPGTNARTLRLIQGGKGARHKGGKGGPGQVNDSASSFSNSSQTTVPVKSLTEVKNPSNLITFRFVNRMVTHLNEIGRFRNLTELDVNGNLLQSNVPELLNLPFLKKLNLSGNQIKEMWSLPKTLEILNIGYNCLKKLDANVMHSLSNLTTLEISNNGIESLEGLENVTRLKRLIARNNQIQSLEPLTNLKLLIEMDLENNPIDSSNQVLRAVQNKKDILLLNLKLAPLMVKIQSYDEFIASVTDENKIVQDFKKLLTFLHNGTFYRRRKIYVRIRQQQQSLHIMERRFSNFSNDAADDSQSNGIVQHNTQSGGAFSHMQKNLSVSGSGTNPYRRANDKLPGPLAKNQRTNSTGLGNSNLPGMMRPNLSQNNQNIGNGTNPQRSQRYEAIISLYDKLLEDEDKLLLQKKRKEARERKLQRQQQMQQKKEGGNDNKNNNSGTVDLDDTSVEKSQYNQYDNTEEDDDLLDVSMDLDDDDDDDLDDDLLSDDLYCQQQQHNVNQSCEDRGDQLKDAGVGRGSSDNLQTSQQYHQHFAAGEEMLNASTADFNKEIKQINQQLMNEGHLVAISSQATSLANAEEDDADSTVKSNNQRSSSRQHLVNGAPNNFHPPSADSPAIIQQHQMMLSSQSSSCSSSNISGTSRNKIDDIVASPNQQKQLLIKDSNESIISGVTLNRQESSAYSDQIDAQEINVVVPIEERSSRYTNRQHHNNPNQNTSANKQQSQGEQLESSVIRQPQFEHQSSCEQLAAPVTDHHSISQRSGTNCNIAKSHAQDQPTTSKVVRKTTQHSFKLDLAKVKNNATTHSSALLKQSQPEHQHHTINTTNRGGAFKKNNNILDQQQYQQQYTAQKHHSLQKVSGVRIVAPVESVRTAKPMQDQLISVRKIQNQISLSQISERIPIKKSQNKSPPTSGKMINQLNQSGTDLLLETSYQSAQHQQQQQKQVHIPKLALQNILRQPSNEQQQQNQQYTNQNHSSQQQAALQPKSLKVLTLSKRDDSVTSEVTCNQSQKQLQSLTIKQSQIVKTLQGKELLDLYEKVDHQRKVINDVKRVLGDTLMTDHCILDRIVAIQDAQRSVQEEHAIYTSQIFNRHQMQIEDLSGQIVRLQAQLVVLNSQQNQLNATTSNCQSRSSSFKLQHQNHQLQQQVVVGQQTTTFLDQLERINESMMSLPNGACVGTTTQQPSKNISSCSPSPLANVAASEHHQVNGGLTMRLKEIRQASNNASTVGVRTTEQQAMLDLLKTTNSSYENNTSNGAVVKQHKQMAKTAGRVQNSHHHIGGAQQPQTTSLLTQEFQQQMQASSTVKVVHQHTPKTIQTEVPPSKIAKQSSTLLQQQLVPTPTVGKASGRNSRRDSGQNITVTMELSSKREYMDQLCQSPSAATPHSNNLNNSHTLKTATNFNHNNKALVTYNDNDTNNTLERASNQDDILGTGGAASKDGAAVLSSRRRKSRIVSDFNPGPIPSGSGRMAAIDDSSYQVHAHLPSQQQNQNNILIMNHSSAACTSGKHGVLIEGGEGDGLTTALAHQHQPFKEQNQTSGRNGEKDDSLRRVGFFLEKIKERNSSLQERLNLSFKKSSRLDQSSISSSYRPTTSFGNKTKQAALRGTLIERECISLTRDLDCSNNNETVGGLGPMVQETNTSVVSHQRRPPAQQQQNQLLLMQIDQASSKTPNIIPESSCNKVTAVTNNATGNNDSQQRLVNWDGMKPQLVRQMPAAAHQQQKLSQQQSLIAQMAKKQGQQQLSKHQHQSLISPTNNYIDFLQTGNLGEMNTAAAKKSHQIAVAQRQQQVAKQQAAQQKSTTTFSAFEENAAVAKQSYNSKQKGSSNSTNPADQSDKGPLFSFYQCTEVLHQLSSTNRSGGGGHHHGHGSTKNRHNNQQLQHHQQHPQSSKNSRSMIAGAKQRGSGGELQQFHPPQSQQQDQSQQQQYSSLLNKQRSSNNNQQSMNKKHHYQATAAARNHIQSSSLLEHASAAEMIKQSTTNSFIQRANSLEMVPRLKNNTTSNNMPPTKKNATKHNNYLMPAPAASKHQREHQHYGSSGGGHGTVRHHNHHQHHVRPNSGSGGATSSQKTSGTAAYWSSMIATSSQQQQPSHLHKLAAGGGQSTATKIVGSSKGGSKTTTAAASASMHHHHQPQGSSTSAANHNTLLQHQAAAPPQYHHNKSKGGSSGQQASVAASAALLLNTSANNTSASASTSRATESLGLLALRKALLQDKNEKK